MNTYPLWQVGILRYRFIVVGIWLVLLFMGSSYAQMTTTPPAPGWSNFTTKEKDFSFLMPSDSTIYNRGEYNTNGFVVYETQEIGGFMQDCAMVVRIFKTNNPHELLNEESRGMNFREAQNTDLKIRGVKAIKYVRHNSDSHFEALGLIYKNHLYLLQALSRNADDEYLKYFFASFYLKSMTGDQSIPIAPPPPTAFSLEDKLPLHPESPTIGVKPIILYAPKALYNNQGRDKHISGVVLLSAVFGVNGSVTQIKILRGLPEGLNEEAIYAAQRIRFLPAYKNGKPVAVRISMEYSFTLL